MIDKNKKIIPKGAGIIIMKRFNNQNKFLALIGPDHLQNKHSGKFDIPKGCVDPGESFFECAQRECFEEANYKKEDYNILLGPWQSKMLKVWLAKTDKDPQLKINPKIGFPEHLGYEWVEPETLLENCYGYLKPCVSWAVDMSKIYV